MFLLDVKQVNAVYENRNVLGDNYYIGQQTQKAVENSSWKHSSLENDENWSYWLRSPYAGSCSSDFVRYVCSDGTVNSVYAFYKRFGVRPAFYLDLSSAIFTSGSGSEVNPYIVSGQSGTYQGDDGETNEYTSPAPASDFNYTISNDEVTITGYKGSGGDVEIPSFIEAKPVTVIGDSAFAYQSSLTSVTIPNGVTRINFSAFNRCWSLTEVIIPDSVTYIGNYAFQRCSELSSVTIPSSVTTIGVGAFAGCRNLIEINVEDDNPNYISLEGVLFNKDVTTLVQFPGGRLGTYSISSSVTTIAIRAFENVRLTSITIPESVTNIQVMAFTGSGLLKEINVALENMNYSSIEGVLFNKDITTLIQYPAGKKGEYIIPDSVTSIGSYSFFSSTWITSITIPDSVTSIGFGAFQNAFHCVSEVTSVTIPASVTRIRDMAFFWCTTLENVIFMGDAPESFGDKVFDYCNYGADVTDEFTIYYHEGSQGWINPWNGYTTEMIPEAIIEPEYIELDKTNTTIAIGKTEIITATVLPENAANKEVNWSVVSGDDIATVSPEGILTAIREGVAVIRATSAEDSDIYAECTVTVEPGTFINIGDDVESILGAPTEIVMSEYGFQWYIYAQDYRNYIQVGVIDSNAVAIYTNSNHYSFADYIIYHTQKFYTPPDMPYTVTFKDWDDSVLKTEEVEHGSSATPPADPVREWHTFIGWDKVFDNVTENLVVTAQYSINEYTVSVLATVQGGGTSLLDSLVIEAYAADAAIGVDDAIESVSVVGGVALFESLESGTDYVFVGRVNKALSKVTQATTLSEGMHIDFGMFNVGDINGDDKVDFDDFMMLLEDYNSSASRSDLNADGIVNFDDFMLLLGSYNMHGPVLTNE